VENWNKHIRKKYLHRVGHLQELKRDVRFSQPRP